MLEIFSRKFRDTKGTTTRNSGKSLWGPSGRNLMQAPVSNIYIHIYCLFNKLVINYHSDCLVHQFECILVTCLLLW